MKYTLGIITNHIADNVYVDGPSQHLIGVDEANPGDDYFKLPPLLDLQPLPSVKLEPDPALSQDSSRPPEVSELAVDDLWLFHGNEQPKQAQIRTWAGFDRGDETGVTATFMTEASSAAFDALLAAVDNPFKVPDNDKYDIVDSSAYSACLLSLALGRSSLLYAWDDQKACFTATLAHVKLQGYSGQTLEGISLACKECGESTRYLQSFVEKIYAAHASPARTALANAIDGLLVTIQSELGSRAEHIKSILQLQALIQPVRSILAYFKGLIKRLARSRSDEQLISMLFEEAHSVEYRDVFLRNAVCEVLRMVSKPWTDFIEEWIGLKPEQGIVMTKAGPGRSFVKVENKMWVDDQGFELEEPDYFLDGEAMPSFVPDDIAHEIFETGRNLRFLRTNHPDHRLAKPDYIAASNPPKLEWQFDWDAMSRVERKAKEYEETLLRFLERGVDGTSKEYHTSNPTPDDTGPSFQFFGKDESQITATILASMRILSNPLPPTTTPNNNLTTILTHQLFSPLPSTPDSRFNPHWSLLPLLSFGPTVASQARIINTECTRLLFAAHDLRAHLRLQRQYHLLGNGLFAARLSHALFDPDLYAASRQAGVAMTGGVMGLRLTGRESWPPASWELRLALMGVLAESYCGGSGERRTGELPRGMDISFAVRDLAPEEIERCVDADSLAALDFLRLSYKPPAALRVVFSPVVLVKYDRVFRLLLRVLRMLYVVEGLFRDVVLGFGPKTSAVVYRFRVEAQNFVAGLAAYWFETGVGEPWRRFEEWLDGVEGELDGKSGIGDRGGKGGRSYGGPDRLRERHEMMLDEILGGLMLRRKQKPVMGLVEDVFGTVLGFAKVLRRRTGNVDGEESEQEVKRLYDRFRKKVEVFITVCRGMSEKGGGRGQGTEDEAGAMKGGRPGEEHSIVRLLLLLDMSGYFARKS
jgi:hypothetical protein